MLHNVQTNKKKVSLGEVYIEKRAGQEVKNRIRTEILIFL